MDPDAEIIIISDNEISEYEDDNPNAIIISSDDENPHVTTANDLWGHSDNSLVSDQPRNMNKLSTCTNECESSSEDEYSYEVDILKRKPGPKSKTTFYRYRKIKKSKVNMETDNNKSVHELIVDCKQILPSTVRSALLAEKGQSSGEIIDESSLESDSDNNGIKVNTCQITNEIYSVSSDSNNEMESDEVSDMEESIDNYPSGVPKSEKTEGDAEEQLSKNDDNLTDEVSDIERSIENYLSNVPKSEKDECDVKEQLSKNDDNIISDVLNKNNSELSDQSKENIDFIDKTKNEINNSDTIKKNNDFISVNDVVQNEIDAGDVKQTNYLPSENLCINITHPEKEVATTIETDKVVK